MVKTMKWENGTLVLLDQTKLPAGIEWIPCTTYTRVGKAIRKLEVRGAPAIGAAAAFAMVLAWRQIIHAREEERDGKASSSNMQLQSMGAMLFGDHGLSGRERQKQYLQEFNDARKKLDASRPTAVNLSWATRLMYEAACKMAETGMDPALIDTELEQLALQIYEQDITKNKKMGEYGAQIVPEDAVILTHCNAGALATCGWGTALGVIRSAHEQGKVKMVYSDETRPLLQGSRLTAWELLEDKIPVTTITDNMAAWSMKTKGINIVITGADRIAANGDTANKIGTYGVALAAKAHGIPFYIAAPASTFDFSLRSGEGIPIEERRPKEVKTFQGRKTAPPGVTVFNPAFDVTPAKLITGIITEYGILRPPYKKAIAELKDKVTKEETFTWKA